MDHIKDSGVINTPEESQTLQNQIYGVEKKQLPHLLCTTNMLLHGIEVPSKFATIIPWLGRCAIGGQKTVLTLLLLIRLLVAWKKTA